MNFKVFAWDFHGTLERGVDVAFWHVLKQITKERGLGEKFKLSEVRALYGIRISEYVKNFFPQISDLETRQIRAKISERLKDKKYLKKFVKPAPRAIEVLKKIKAAGHANIIISNSSRKHLEPLVQMVGMEKLIDRAYAIEQLSINQEIDPISEKTKILRAIISDNDLSSGDLICIGDSIIDINSGLAVGAITYQYLREGYLEKTGAKFKIHDLREVLREAYAD